MNLLLAIRPIKYSYSNYSFAVSWIKDKTIYYQRGFSFSYVNPIFIVFLLEVII